mmetsp:Transcript_26109/g.57041  ORF Transcript_26109/g.57041 Transcript_26109/m.57041 type:complete len:1764 (+) Transcript_26109:195-5486(+)|eukprot:CAMPEP_0202890294 /NCGR_PEP_ID=MMETSP1392-20130828/754_1 /ASSEMBLY_ACC=CAM_ASM_000868 /TAXON_ID=225041 /ORGANISM="Chlamydomonas chlamydogama, Strain SAG 11-48b" /LENGTH=1763 /DNA_ID=CAMNT_0049573839 /DNA_START=130 /DNA_END=5421 /DNA_ORIENTATION=-
MQLRFLKTILPPSDGLQKITSLCWAPNNGKLAAVTTDKVVYLFDDNGERKDKFKTKPADAANTTNYIVRAMAFSPDSTKLAIAQSDNIVFIYRLGETWTDKKSICNKFLQSTPVTCLVWPRGRDDVVFGLSDGKIKLGMLKTNKPYTMYTHPENSYVVSLASSPNGQSIISGHLDGSIWKFTFPAEEGAGGLNNVQLVNHSCVPYALGWGNCIVAAGNDNRVVFYDVNGRELQVFDYSTDDSVREFCSCSFNPSGETVVLGTYNRFYVYSYNISRNTWEEVGMKQVDNFYSVSALSWKPDGSKLCVGSMTGTVDMYDACVRRHRYKGKFEFTYVSKSSVIVKELKSGKRIVLKSVYGWEIDKINIYKDRFLVARTAHTLLMGDLESCKLSEIEWRGDGSEKYIFDNESVCIVYYAGELTIVAYGRNEVLGVCRTEHLHPTLLSVVVQEGMVSDGRGGPAEMRLISARFAYLIDLQTIRVIDLLTPHNSTLATINHDSRIDWLELNHRGTHLLFRDKKRHLNLYNLQRQERTTLLNYSGYVQWVPQSDVVVAQSRDNLCVWYSINTPDRVSMFPIKGELMDIERTNNRTEVIVDEGINTVSYALDEQLIEALTLIQFGAAMGEQNFERAVRVLEPLELTPETEAQWMELSELALQNNQVVIAERCYAALGDIAKTRYLHKVVKQAQRAAKEFGGNGYDAYSVRAQLAQLHNQWPVAENLLLQQGKVDDAMVMYQEAHRWEDAIRVAESSRHPDAEALKSRYYKWLLETAQEEKAGLVKEREGDYLGAISLYLKGGLPARAAQVVMQYHISHDPALLDSILSQLAKAGLFERAGELYEYLGRSQDALMAYRRGHAYRKAIDLARREFPSTVIEVEEEWGDWLMTQKQMDAAINHFIEAGRSMKAIEAAIQCRQFSKAAGIIDFLDHASALPYYKRIAQHYESTKNFEEAERYYIKADMAINAVDMYSRAGKWEAAQKVARGYLTDTEMRSFYRKKAREFEASHKFKEAEKAYVQGEEYDMAINMYKKNRMYDQMINLVQHYRKDQLAQAHMLVAQQLETEGNLREAEKHYTDAKDWKAAVQMYRAHTMWEDALRVAKGYGGVNASKQVAYAWAISLGGDEGAVLLKKLGLLEQAIDYAIESGAFQQAFELTRAGAKAKLPEVHLKYAMFLEDEGRFQEAEAEFISAQKPKEAVDMYIHNQDWDSGMRVAEQYDPASVSDVLIAQARSAIERKQYQLAEAMYLKAKRPELALKMFRDAGMWHDALRIAEDYLPGKVQEIHMELASGQNKSSSSASVAGPDSIIAKAKKFEQNNDYARAIETYLSLTTADTNNHDALEQCWEQAASLAMNYQRHRMHDVINVVSQRLSEIQRYQAAAELHESIDDIQGAIRLYCSGQMFDRARQLAGNNPTFNSYIEDQYNSHLIQNKAADELAVRGGQGAQQAIDMYVQRDDWDKVHELAAKQGPEVAAMYAARHAERRFKQGEYGQAAQAFALHGISANSAYFELYRGIALGILTASSSERTADGEKALKDMMFRLVNALQVSTAVKKAELEEFRRLYLAAHYISISNQARGAGHKELAAKALTSALRYTGIVPADRAFFEAGVAWKEAGRLNMAFVMLNRFLDLVDAMDDPNSSAAVIENADFADTDIPFDFHIPQRPYVDEDGREDVRNFVLEISMDQQVEQALSLRTCEQCGTETYEANLTCHHCKHKWEPCAVSGYPVQAHEKVVSKQNGYDVLAIRDHWNQWVTSFHTCPVTNGAATPMY